MDAREAFSMGHNSVKTTVDIYGAVDETQARRHFERAMNDPDPDEIENLTKQELGLLISQRFPKSQLIEILRTG